MSVNLNRIHKQKPRGRSGHASILIDNLIVTFGGYTDIEDYLFNELILYHIYKNDFQIIKIDENIKDSVASTSITKNNNKIYFFGGTGYPFGENCSNKLSCYDLSTKKWNYLSNFNEYSIQRYSPFPMYGASMVCFEDRLYICFGTDGYTFFNDIYCYDLNKKRWKILNIKGQLPNPASRVGITIYQRQLYTFGGASSNENTRFLHISVFNFDNSTWSTIYIPSPHPPWRMFESFCFTNTHAFMCGGRNNENVYFNDIWVFEFKTLKWTKLPQILDFSVAFHSSCIKDNILYVFGGTRSNQVRINNIQKITIGVKPLFISSIQKSYDNKCEKKLSMLNKFIEYEISDKR